ncbi:manganese efflux pump MntP family protein [Legionella cincinnatiensis]|uniref:Manganese efflux pump MntP n=1 Tax=Legionella cincinnatiensis TaxID=28085 RepID=A0A378ILA2_9GAMM|nr:manganese efflux pump [Legionella cincinnatiensis]KTC83054.1 putative manganese efflux pump MntP [Legionella cincinnatiensis]STX35906.1 putative sporulation protein YtaF [Legionella cincinnatiensis]
MSFFEPIILGLVLSADSFSAAIAMGLKPHTLRDSFKFAFLSGGAEFIATFIGAITGEKVISQFSSIDHWIAFLLLLAVSIHMLYEGFVEWKNRNSTIQGVKFHGLIKLLSVAIATSLDALAVGVSLGVSNKPLWPYLISIGGWAFASTIMGMGIAKKIPQRLSAVFNIIGACILLILAVEMMKL